MIEYKPIYSVVEVAKILKICPDSVRYDLIATRKLPAIRLYDKSSLKVRGKDLEAFINGITPEDPQDPEIPEEILTKLYAV